MDIIIVMGADKQDTQGVKQPENMVYYKSKNELYSTVHACIMNEKKAQNKCCRLMYIFEHLRHESDNTINRLSRKTVITEAIQHNINST